MSTKLLPEMDLKDIMVRAAYDHPELTPDQLEEAEDGYRRFLLLNCHYPETPMSPTSLWDKVWHTHILFTEQYQQDCLALFGRFLHHRPYTATTAMGIKQAAAGNLRTLYLKHFGSDPFPNARVGDCDTQSCQTLPSCETPPSAMTICHPKRIPVPGLPLAEVAASVH